MPNVGKNLIKGNYGVYALMKELSKFCLIRPVFEGTDVGIDLYCETLEKPAEGGRPFLHFWAQVKTTENETLRDGTISFSFESRHIKYWSRQPVPVFAFIVCVPNWPSTDSIYPFYIIDIKSYAFQNQRLLEGGEHTLRSNFTINSEEKLKDFILNMIPYISAYHKISEGIVPSMPSIDPEYEVKSVMESSHLYLDRILWQIRRTSARAIIGSYDHALESDNIKKNIKKLKIVSAAFKDDLHWETPFSIGLASSLDGDYAEAKVFFSKALEIIKMDPNIQGKDNWERTKEYLKEKIAECDQRI
ncbi:MAG: DUF4365 domain-containing protein [Methanothrix sp.]